MLHSHKQTNSSNIYYKVPHTHFYTRALANCLHGLFAQYVGWEGEPKEGLGCYPQSRMSLICSRYRRGWRYICVFLRLSQDFMMAVVSCRL